MNALYGSYEPTGMYSVEFRNRKSGSKITEIFFMLPPESVKVREKQRATITPTLGSGYIADHGNEFKDITVQGSSHFYYAGTARNPAAQYGAQNGAAPSDYIDGFTEFIKLRFMLMRYRDYVMTPNSKLIAPNFGSAPDLAGVNGLKAWVNNQLDDGAGALADDVECVWHDYDYDDHFKVKVDSYEAARSKDDPWTVSYDIQMTGYEVDDRASSAVVRAPNIKKATPLELLKRANDQAGPESVETMPDSLPIASPSTTTLQTTAVTSVPNQTGSGDPTTNAVGFSMTDSTLTGDPTLANLTGLDSGNATTNRAPLPVEIQQDISLLSYNERVRALRAQFAQATAQTQTGAFSAKRVFGIIVDDLLSTLRTAVRTVEALIIPKQQFVDFENGIVTLDDFASFDMLKYYNGLRKLIIIFTQAKVALQQLAEVPQQPVQPPRNSMQAGVLDTLDDSEFLDQGYGTPVAEAVPKYRYYTIRQGDTLQSIAAKVYSGNTSRWPDISAANNLLESDLIDQNLIGLTIKIPVDRASSGPSRAAANLVYEPAFNGTDQALIERYLHGVDLYVREGRLMADAQGDLMVVQGIPGTVQNINDRLNNIRGSLNPLHSDWGIELPNDYAQTPYAIALDRTLTAMEGQAAADPRVLFASIDRRNIRITGDALRADMEIRLIGGSTSKETFDVPSL